LATLRGRGVMKKWKLPRPRKTWGINPVTRVKESERKYARGKAKRNLRKELDES
jgi:hypothetical protein